MSWISSAVGGALGTVGTIAANLSGDKARKELLRLREIDPQYQESEAAKQRYGLAQNLLNARMPGAAGVERNIYTNQAGTNAGIDNNATDSSQALAMKAVGQANTNKAFANLGTQEQQDYYNRLSNLTGAEQGMTDENDKSYQDNVRRWQDQVNIALGRNAIRQTQGQNLVNLGGMFSSMNFGGGGAK